MTTQEIQATVEDLFTLDEQIRRTENDLKEMKATREQWSSVLADELGKGGAVLIHDGKTIAYVGDGRRTINKHAIEAHAEQLPASLLPREETVIKYPGVGDVDKREADLKARGVDPSTLVTFSGARWIVHFRASED